MGTMRGSAGYPVGTQGTCRPDRYTDTKTVIQKATCLDKQGLEVLSMKCVSSTRDELIHDVGLLLKAHRDYINNLSHSEYQEFKKRRAKRNEMCVLNQ